MQFHPQTKMPRKFDRTEKYAQEPKSVCCKLSFYVVFEDSSVKVSLH